MTAYARERWLAGDKGSEIAAALNAKFGDEASRSAVIGRMRRKGVPFNDERV